MYTIYFSCSIYCTGNLNLLILQQLIDELNFLLEDTPPEEITEKEIHLYNEVRTSKLPNKLVPNFLKKMYIIIHNKMIM